MATENTPAPFVPCTFGRYQLLERLAVGGMAEIFRAKQTGVHGFEKILVIKRILPHLAADPEFLAMFVDEAKLQCALEHPKIVQVLEFGEADGQYYIALEYVEGMDTLGLLRACAHRRQRLPVRLAVHIACEVLDALDYAHGKRDDDGRALGIVHRDVSPSNVFISRRGDVKLGDFGIARAVEQQRQSKTQAGTLKGKYGYMAPEQVVGSEIDGRADLFAVGIVLAEMLMGRRLFTAATDLDVLLMVRDARLDRLDRHGNDVPPPLRDILNKMLARDPAGRFPTAGATRDALQEFLYEARQRVSPTDLGGFLETLRGDQVAPAPMGESGLLMLGEDTRARRDAAERHRLDVVRASQDPAMQRAAREVERSVGQSSELPRMVPIEPRLTPDPDAPSITIEGNDTGPFIEPASAPTPAFSVEQEEATTPPLRLEGTPTPVEEVETPDQKGDLGDVTPARLFARLATERDTGELTIERQGVIKEIYLVDGVPEFVSSNVPSERFGEYLVGRGVISPGELSMALAILPRFQGKLGDTLVGLSLLRPLEVFRHLTRQVREKIIDVFAWTTGSYRFYRGRINQRESFPLGLDAFEILGAGVAGLPLDVVRARLDRVAQKRVRRIERARPTPEHFRVGAGPRELWQRLDGKRTVGDWIRRYDQPEQRLTLCRTLYLLVEADLAALD
ncbi:MAG TPA: protein kinase [Polyangia bacterium]|jgi:serine/threonine-protein kinase